MKKVSGLENVKVAWLEKKLAAVMGDDFVDNSAAVMGDDLVDNSAAKWVQSLGHVKV